MNFSFKHYFKSHEWFSSYAPWSSRAVNVWVYTVLILVNNAGHKFMWLKKQSEVIFVENICSRFDRCCYRQFNLRSFHPWKIGACFDSFCDGPQLRKQLFLFKSRAVILLLQFPCKLVEMGLNTKGWNPMRFRCVQCRWNLSLLGGFKKNPTSPVRKYLPATHSSPFFISSWSFATIHVWLQMSPFRSKLGQTVWHSGTDCGFVFWWKKLIFWKNGSKNSLLKFACECKNTSWPLKNELSWIRCKHNVRWHYISPMKVVTFCWVVRNFEKSKMRLSSATSTAIFRWSSPIATYLGTFSSATKHKSPLCGLSRSFLVEECPLGPLNF